MAFVITQFTLSHMSTDSWERGGLSKYIEFRRQIMVTTAEEGGQLIFEICLFLILCTQFHIDLVFSEDIVKVFVLVPFTGFA